MVNERHQDLLFEFIGNYLYLQEIEDYKVKRFTRTYGAKTTCNKNEEAHLICDLMAASFISTLEKSIKTRQNEIITILKQAYRHRFKLMMERFAIAMHESGLILPLPDGIQIFAGDFIEELNLEGDDISDMLRHFEFCNYSWQSHQMCNDDFLAEEMRKIEREMFKVDKGISKSKGSQPTEPKMDESIINFFLHDAPNGNNTDTY